MEKISVILPVYNGAKFLREAIESVLNQSYENFEFIIINDGSTDDSLDIIKSYNDNRIVIINQNNQGLVKSLNNGLKKSKHQLIARMDADDISDVNRFYEQITFMNNHPDAAMVGTQAQIISEDGRFLYTSQMPTSPNRISEYLKKGSPFFHGSVMFRKIVLEKNGGYDENIIHFVEDLILWKKLNLTNKLYNLDVPLYKYRLRYNALSNRPKRIEKKMFKLCDQIVGENDAGKKEIYYNKINQLFIKLRKTPQKKMLANYHQTLARIYLTRNKQLNEAYNNLIAAFRYYPFNYKIYYYYIFYLFSKFKLYA